MKSWFIKEQIFEVVNIYNQLSNRYNEEILLHYHIILGTF